MYYCKKEHMICFDVNEIIGIFKATKQREISEICEEKNIDKRELLNNKQKMELIVNEIVEKSKRKKEDIEVFIAIDDCLTWYSDADKKVCFVLKSGVQGDKLNIEDLDDLKKVVEESTLTDFAIWSNGLRKFQLKQYKEDLTTDCFFEKIKKILDKYGNDLGQTNLLFVLQSDDKKVKIDIDFKDLNKKLIELKIKNIGEILVQYNQNNNFIVINQIYPEVKSMRKKLSLPSFNWTQV
jgi:hypothetical protein